MNIKTLSRTYFRKLYILGMLRRIISLAIIAILIVTNWGLSVSTHFCHGHKESVSIAWFDQSSVDSKGCTSHQSACCHSDTQYLSSHLDLLSPDNNAKTLVQNFGKIIADFELPFLSSLSPKSQQLVILSNNAGSPPFILAPTWLRLSVFLS